MSCHHLTTFERGRIQELLSLGYSKRAIAREINGKRGAAVYRANRSRCYRQKVVSTDSKLEALGTKVYFAHPYSSWERPVNKHSNRILQFSQEKEAPKQFIERGFDSKSPMNGKLKQVLMGMVAGGGVSK